MGRQEIKAWALAAACAIAAWSTATARATGQDASDWGTFDAPDLVLPSAPAPWLLKSAPEGSLPAPEDPRFLSSVTVIPQLTALESASNARFRVALLDDAIVTIVRESLELRASGVVWFGHIDGEPASSVVLSQVGDSLSGSIRSFGHDTHVIVPAAGRLHWFRQANPAFHFPEARFGIHGAANLIAAHVCADPQTDIDVMVLYTPGSLQSPDPNLPPMTPEMAEAEIYRFVGEANYSFFRCDIDLRLHLVHLQQFDFPDSELDICKIAADFRRDATVEALRDQFEADIAVLLISPTHDAAGCTEFLAPAPSYSSAEDAYCVATLNESRFQMSMTHEIGHVLGADHECGGECVPLNDPGDNHGKDLYDASGVIQGTTIMSGSHPTIRKPYWSYPAHFIALSGSSIDLGSTGGTCNADNQSILSDNAHYVARYRCSSIGSVGVWMKDTWNDTGSEPTVLQPGEVLWNSPYIWVRWSPDPLRVHEHDHVNPDAGGRVWIYVKLQNGDFADASGNLELYWADSAPTASWPTDWHLIHSTPTTVPGSTSIDVETLWDPVPPASDSISLLARWNSTSEPMSEGTDIYQNVLNSNNLVWKSLKIVNLPNHGDIGSARLIIHPPLPDPIRFPYDAERERLRRIRIGVAPPPKGLLDSIIRVGRVRVHFDDVLMSAWMAAGAQGSGYRIDGDSFLLSSNGRASFDLLLPDTASGQAEFSFERLATTPNGRYRIDVTQTESDQVVGGASYDIRVGPTRPDDASPSEAPEAPASGDPGR